MARKQKFLPEEFGDSPSSPALPNSARLADSEIFDTGPNLNSIKEEGKNGNGDAAVIKKAPTGSRRSRHFSTGQPWLYSSFSGDDENAVCGFVQLYVLSDKDKTSGDREWGEISRWVKYEQDLEEGSSRLGRPHIAPLGHLFLSKLHRLIGKSCTELFDLNEHDMQSIAEKVVENLLNKGLVDKEEGESLLQDLLLNHRPVGDRRKMGRASFQRGQSFAEPMPDEESRRHSLQRRIVHEGSPIMAGSFPKQFGTPDHVQVEVCETPPGREGGRSRRGTFSGLARYFSTDDVDVGDQPFLSYSPLAESSMIMVRGGYKRRNGAIVLVRLSDAILLDCAQQFLIPTRFIAIILSPTGCEDDYIEIGKSLGTLLSNIRFYKSVQTAKDSKSILTSINEFLDESIILPPGKWYTQNFYQLLPVHVLEEKSDLICRQNLKDTQQGLHRCGTSSAEFVASASESGPQPEKNQMDQIPGPFEWTKKPFGGLINDIKRRYPLYKSDILDGLNSQTLAATIFLFFAALAHNVTFGGLLEQKTDGLIGVPETLVAASASGIIYSLLAGQPLNCIAPTGPLLVFDELLFKFMERHDIEFLPARVWIGMWVVIIALVVIAFEGSVLVKHFTRFTMETFSALISIIFCYECLESLIHVYKTHPLSKEGFLGQEAALNSTDDAEEEISREPNTALLSTFLMFGTFYIAFTLKHLRTTNLFPSKIRNTLGDFSVPIAILLMVSVACFCDVHTTNIKVPSGLEPTTPSRRGWIISPFGNEKPYNYWIPLITLLPGALVFLLMFMTVEICQKIMLARGNLRKGCGMHLDPLVLAITNFGCGIFGFPWVSVATLKALAHIAALAVYSKPPPGVPPTIIEIRENRVSAFVMSILLGASIFMAPILKLIPMPVLFGVFLYMGITSFIPTQLHDRLVLFLVPVDQHPQTFIYVRRVKTWKMHLFTLIQICSLASLWAVKSVKEIALFFPIILMLLVPIRRSLQYIYTESELEALDGETPPVAAKPAEKTN